MGRKTTADNFVKAVSDAAESHEIMKRESEKSAADLQTEREDAIRNIYEMVGKVKATNFFRTQAEFFNLLMLKKVKDSKEYRDRFGMTWEEFCNNVGVKRRTIDLHLEDLEPFRQDFLATFANFSGVTINKIKYLGMAVSGKLAEITDNAIIYNGETIPIDPEHKEEIQTLLETLEEEHKKQIEEKDSDLLASKKVLKDKEKVINRQARDLAKYEKRAEAQGLTPEEDAFLQQMENLRTSFDGFYMADVDPERMEELTKENGPTPRMIAAYLTTLDYMKKQILVAHSIATDRYGNAAMCPEDAWQPGMGAALPDKKGSNK